MNTTEQESLEVAEGTRLEMFRSSAKSNLNLEGGMRQTLEILSSKPQYYTYFLLLAFAKQHTEGDDNCYTILSGMH